MSSQISPPQASQPPTLKQLLAPCFEGMKRNLRPGIALQAFALALVLGYYFAPGAKEQLDQLGGFKERHGYLYSAIVTAFFGGVVPYLFLLYRGQVPAHRRYTELLFYFGFWFWKGAEVDALYRFQAFMFGNEASFSVIAQKTLSDQLGYNVFWAAPTQTFFYLWKDSDFSLTKLKARLHQKPFLWRWLTVLFSAWLVWIPTVAIVYSLPSALQISIYNLVLCFWCLLLSYLSRES